MYNVPHKYRQVCRLCLTLVNECDIADLQIYNREAASSNKTPKTLHKVNIKQCNTDENLSKCVCNALDPITCCCKGVADADNPLSVMQGNKQISPCNRNPQQKNNYTPSVPSSAAINANPPCTTTITAETTNVYARMFSNQNQRQQQQQTQQYLPTKSNQQQTEAQEEICELTNPKCLEEQQQQQFIQDNPKSTSSKNAHHEICENTSTNEIYNQEHKDDSSPHITIQIFNCLSIKVRQSCF